MTERRDDGRPAQGQQGPDAGPQPDQPQIVVSDPEDFARTRQLRTVFDARDDYQQKKVEIMSERMDDSERKKRIWKLMQRFAMAVEPLADKHQEASRFWTEKTYKANGFAFVNNVAGKDKALAFVQEKRPAEYEEYQDLRSEKQRESDRILRKRLSDDIIQQLNKIRWLATPRPAKFDGISDMLDKTPAIAYLSDSKTNDIESTYPPIELSDEVWRDLNTFIDRIGLGFDTETTKQTKIDDDLLSEVEEWRQTNI